jgi:putative FmdB family regulatory protein
LPTYEYRCLSCEHQFERFQRMSDDPVKECEVCGEPVKRLLFPVAVHFKGNGFYSTDYAKKNALGSAGTSAGNGNGGGADSSSSGDEKGSADTAKPCASSTPTPAPAATTAKND